MSDAATTTDQIDGAPHPRETARLFGQEAAERGFLAAYGAGRLHHAWLLTGPAGVGKATLAWRIARFLLATPDADNAQDALFGAPPPPQTLDISEDHPVARRILAGSEPGLHVIRRSVNEKTGKPNQEILVDDVRRLSGFLTLSAADGGRRVVIVDSADEMRAQAANALLKMLEEPPARTTLLLISHQPSRLLPTIRSRCRGLTLNRLTPDDVNAALSQAGYPAAGPEIAALADGSVGAAIRLAAQDGVAIYGEICALLASLPDLDRRAALRLADSVGGAGKADRFLMVLDLMDIALARLARCGATGNPPAPEAAPGEAAMFARLAPDAHSARKWATLAQKAGARTRRGRSVNLDPAALVLDTLVQIQQTAAA